MNTLPEVLFVCVHNAGRSQMAAGLLDHHAAGLNTLMSAEADAVCGALYGQSNPERVNCRNGYRHREFDTRAGTLDVAIPKLREGSYHPDWLLERHHSGSSRRLAICGAPSA